MPALSSLASKLGFNLSEKTSSAVLIELDDRDNPISSSARRFQYFPDTISDSKSSNWVVKEIPGGSLPLYQWVSGGERTLSFQAVFTTDIDFSAEALGDKSASDAWASLKSNGVSDRNVDIRSAILWLRRFMMPRYGDPQQTGVPLTSAPRKAQLYLPGSGIGLAHGGISTVHDGGDYITVIMRSCDTEYIQFFPSGMPRIVQVNLSFSQIAQIGGAVYFPATDDATDKMVYSENYTPTIFPYRLEPKKG